MLKIINNKTYLYSLITSGFSQVSVPFIEIFIVFKLTQEYSLGFLGEYEFYKTISQIFLVPMFSFGLPRYFLLSKPLENISHRNSGFNNLIVFILVLVTIYTIIYFGIEWTQILERNLHKGDTVWIKQYLLPYALLTIINNLVKGWLISNHYFKLSNLSNLIVSFGLLLAILLIDLDIYHLLLFGEFIIFICLITYTSIIQIKEKRIAVPIDKSKIKQAIILEFNKQIELLTGRLDIIILKFLSNSTTTGLYSLIFRVSKITQMIHQGISPVLDIDIREISLTNNFNKYVKLRENYILLVSVLSAPLIFSLYFLNTLHFDFDALQTIQNNISLVLSGSISMVGLLILGPNGSVLSLSNRYNILLKTNFKLLLINIVLSFVLIKVLGLRGVLLSLSIMTFLKSLLFYISTQKSFNLQNFKLKSWPAILLFMSSVLYLFDISNAGLLLFLFCVVINIYFLFKKSKFND